MNKRLSKNNIQFTNVYIELSELCYNIIISTQELLESQQKLNTFENTKFWNYPIRKENASVSKIEKELQISSFICLIQYIILNSELLHITQLEKAEI